MRCQTLLPLTLLALTDIVAAHCIRSTSAFKRLPDVETDDFGYDALQGPLNWYALNKSEYAECHKGRRQSPIVINSTTIETVKGSTIDWTVPKYPNGAEFSNTGVHVEVAVNGTLKDSTSGKHYKSQQFHFHTPGEHRVDSEFYPMEMHWVFENDDSE